MSYDLKNKRLTKTGKDFAVFIPRSDIKHQRIDPEKMYNIEFVEVEGE